MNTTPLSTLISSCSSTQLFLFFPLTHFDSSIDHLHLRRFTLNSSKTEFLLIGVSKQLAKINNSSTPLTPLETSASYLMNASLFLTRSHLSPNLAITVFLSFAVSVHTWIPKQLPPSPLPLFTPSSTTATLFITTCQSLRSPGFNRSRTLLHVRSHQSHPSVSALLKDN